MKSNVQLKNRIINLVTGIFTIATLIGLTYWGIKTWFFSTHFETTNDAQVEMYISPVTSRLTGYIKDIRFEENQTVHKGDTLIIIDNADYKVQVDAAEANEDNSREQIGIISQQTTAAEKDVLVNETKINAAKAELQNAEKEYQRYKSLYDLQSATGQQLDNKKTAMDVAKASYASALGNVSAAQARVTSVASQKAAILAEIKHRNAIAKQNKITLSYTVVTAPFDGIMGRRSLEIGQLVQPGQTMANIIDTHSGKWVIANFKETQIAEMKIGEIAEIEIDAVPNKKFKGKIESFSAATGALFSALPPDNSTGNFVKTAQRIPIKIRFEKDADLYRVLAGMNAVVNIKKEQ